MDLNDFDYHLPKELIAQSAVEPRDSCKLMVVDESGVKHRHFYDIVDYFQSGDVLVLNETKVSRAKIVGKKTSGGAVEIMLCKRLDETKFICRIKHHVNVGSICQFGKGLECRVVDKNEDEFTIEFNRIVSPDDEKEFLLPLPPYVKEKVTDENSYQTVYSSKEGSLAAPTAGLHFTPELLSILERKGVKIAKICLHVGFGTFLPIRTDIVEKHKMHSEEYEVSPSVADLINNRNGRLIVVGTTSVRTLESCADTTGKVVAGKGATSIFIYPGYKFKNHIDGMITNFHLPKSTLLLLVSAYFGRERMLNAYSIAVSEKYRFYSLGDAMFLKTF